MAALLHSDRWCPCSAVLISMFKSYVFMILFVINYNRSFSRDHSWLTD